MIEKWRARRTARTIADLVSRGSRRCIAGLMSTREAFLTRRERPCAPAQTGRVEIACVAIFERRPLAQHRENRLLLPFHDLPLLLLLGDPSARVQDHSAEL